ncbi:MAG: hypothetical protein D6E12_11935 [Desulfovibrio sp.]|nr:MAG: hypothetical protein D6E12_11935 [Desulfovibrio sp.]
MKLLFICLLVAFLLLPVVCLALTLIIRKGIHADKGCGCARPIDAPDASSPSEKNDSSES